MHHTITERQHEGIDAGVSSIDRVVPWGFSSIYVFGDSVLFYFPLHYALRESTHFVMGAVFTSNRGGLTDADIPA